MFDLRQNHLRPPGGRKGRGISGTFEKADIPGASQDAPGMLSARFHAGEFHAARPEKKADGIALIQIVPGEPVEGGGRHMEV